MDPNSSNNQNNDSQSLPISHIVIPAPESSSVISQPLPQPVGPTIIPLSQDPISPLSTAVPIVESVNPFSSQIPSVAPVSPLPPVEQTPTVVSPLIQPTNEPILPPLPDPLLTQTPLVDNTVKEINEEPKKGKVNKKIAALVLIILFIVALPITIFVSQQQQNTQSGAAVSLTPETVIAVFNGQNILEKDLEKVALEQYDSTNSIDTEVLKNARETLIERKTLDYEKAQKSIAVTQDEINKKQADGFDVVSAPYEVLKDKITIVSTKSWQAISIGFWLPPSDELSDLTAGEKTTRVKQLQDGLKAMDDAKDQLQAKKDPLDIARDLVKKYPSLAAIIGVNGYFIKDIDSGTNLLDFTTSRIYTYEKSNVGQPFFDTLYSMKTAGQIKKAISNKDSGASIIKLIKAKTDARYDTYEAWLTAREEPLVQRVYAL